jgi:hypothetical protein
LNREPRIVKQHKSRLKWRPSLAIKTKKCVRRSNRKSSLNLSRVAPNSRRECLLWSLSATNIAI